MWPVIDRLENEFGSFTVEELNYEGRQARVLFSGPLHSAQSGIPLDSNPRLLFDYNQLLFEAATKLEPKSVLILGGGTMTLPSALNQALPNAKINVVETNKDLLPLAAKYFNFSPTRKLKVTIGDAYSYLARHHKQYDFIVVDIYNDFTIPDQIMSLKFAALINKTLSPGGIVATNCISAISGERSMPLRRTAYSYSSEIGRVKVLKVDKQYPEIIPQNLLILASGSQQLLNSVLPGIKQVDYVQLLKPNLL